MIHSGFGHKNPGQLEQGPYAMEEETDRVEREDASNLVDHQPAIGNWMSGILTNSGTVEIFI